jgi:hypothetical protein
VVPGEEVGFDAAIVPDVSVAVGIYVVVTVVTRLPEIDTVFVRVTAFSETVAVAVQ